MKAEAIQPDVQQALKKKVSFHLWIWFYIAFAVLLLAWLILIRTALQHQPERIPLPSHSIKH